MLELMGYMLCLMDLFMELHTTLAHSWSVFPPDVLLVILNFLVILSFGIIVVFGIGAPAVRYFFPKKCERFSKTLDLIFLRLYSLIYDVTAICVQWGKMIWLTFWGFLEYYGMIKSVFLAIYFRYLMMTVGYPNVPGPDQLWLNHFFSRIFCSAYTPFLVLCGLIVFLVPRQALRRDKLVRHLYRSRIFATYRQASIFVKIVSWSILSCSVLYVGWH